MPSLKKALKIFDEQGCDMLCLLGDILNYGPRNGLPEGLVPKAITEKLNAMADIIVAVRGNCDSEVDQMLIQFPIMQDSALIVDNGTMICNTGSPTFPKGGNVPTLAIYENRHISVLDIDGNVIESAEV